MVLRGIPVLHCSNFSSISIWNAKDPVSVIYTYREFRTANSQVETREGVEFIGYQMVKMGDYRGAIELLGANEIDPTFKKASDGLDALR